MINNIGRLDTQRALKLFAEWTDKINAGALPAEHPSRPQGSRAQPRHHPMGLVDSQGLHA